MFKNIIKTLISYRLPILPCLFNALKFDNTNDINLIKREIPLIVSLYASASQFNNISLSINSIFNQTISPDRVILWISDDFELNQLPYSITKFIKNGLEICFVKDKQAFTNNIYALKEFTNSVIITADCNIIYPKRWIELLYHSYIAHPNDIHVHKALEIDFKNSKISSFKNWKRYVDSETSSFKNVPVSTGGILYPPKCFCSDIFREDVYGKYNISWNIWCWLIAVVSNRKIRVVKGHIKYFYCINVFQKIKEENSSLKQASIIDSKIKTIMEYYKQNIIQKLK